MYSPRQLLTVGEEPFREGRSLACVDEGDYGERVPLYGLQLPLSSRAVPYCVELLCRARRRSVLCVYDDGERADSEHARRAGASSAGGGEDGGRDGGGKCVM